MANQTKKKSKKKSARTTSLVAKELKKNPHLQADVLYEIAEDVDKYAALKDVCLSPGGEILVETLFDDAANITDDIAANYSRYKLEDFQARSARLSVVLNLARSLLRAGENLEGADETLKEALRG